MRLVGLSHGNAKLDFTKKSFSIALDHTEVDRVCNA